MSLPGFTFNITGASGATGLLGPKNSYRCYVFPRGGYAAQDSTGTKITFDSASVASRFAVGNWIQSGLLTANIRQVGAVGGNSLTVSGAALTVTTNDRIYLIGNTEPTISGGSATYTTPNTIVRQRDDDAATLYANSMLTTNTDGMVQGFAVTALYDLLIQDGNRANQGSLIDLPVGVPEGISTSDAATIGATLTVSGNGVFGASVSVSGTLHSTRGPGLVRYADEFASIQAAINDLPAGGGCIVLSAGTTYTITAALTSVANLTIEGMDRLTSTIKQTTNNTRGIVLSDNVTLKNFRMIGTGVGASGLAIDGGSSDDCLIDGLVIEGWGGVQLSLANSSTRCRVMNCIVRNGASEGIYAGDLCVDIQITNNIVYGNSNNGIDVNGSRCIVSGNVCRNNGVSPNTTDTCGIIIGHASGKTSTDNVVVGNVCDSNVQHGIFVWGGGTVQRYTIADNVCKNTANGWGIACIGSAGASFSNIAVNGNVCYANNADGIAINGVDDSAFVGNICLDNGSDGIQMYATGRSCSRNIVSGNILRGNTGFGLIADHSSVINSVITGNLTSGNIAGQIGTISSSTNVLNENSANTSLLTQAASLALGDGDFFGVSGTLGAGTSISTITPLTTKREVTLWSEKGTVGFSASNTLRIVGSSANIPVNSAVRAFCTGTTWFVFSPSS